MGGLGGRARSIQELAQSNAPADLAVGDASHVMDPGQLREVEACEGSRLRNRTVDDDRCRTLAPSYGFEAGREVPQPRGLLDDAVPRQGV